MTSPHDPWARIAAESELRPPRGPVQEVPGSPASAQSHDGQVGPPVRPIRLDEVPAAATTAVPTGTARPTVTDVPYTAPVATTEPVEVVAANPYPMAPAPDQGPPPPLITEVPAPAPDPEPPLVDLPENASAAPAKTSWWQVMLGKGGAGE